MKNTQAERNNDVQEKYNSQFAVTLRELLEKSPRTNERTTYKALAEKLNVKQQSVSSWANGDTIADTKHLAPIAEYFGVSTDYLLGLTEFKKADVSEREINEKYGLFDEALNALSDMPEPDFRAETYNVDSVQVRCGDTMEYRNVINLLLSEEHGKEALRLLHAYFFSQMHLTPEAPPFSSTLRIDGNRSFTRKFSIDETILRKYLLECATDELNKLWFERNKANEKN
jgi:transcriptional regulator with XRE-family HTH domain